MDPKLPSNPTAMLMQAQERKKLVNNLINLKKGVNQNTPSSFSHLGSGRVHRRNDEVRKINAENQQMLKKIMGIMNRKPKGNGLTGVPLKRNSSLDDEADQSIDQKDNFQGNADISLIQSNIESGLQNNRFSFEINPAMSQNKSNNPFKADHDQAVSQNQMGYRNDTQPLNNSPQDNGADNMRGQNATQILASSGPADGFDESSANNQHLDQANDQQKAKNPFGISEGQIVSATQSQNFGQKDVQASSMFDNNIPPTESENRLAFHPQNQSEIGETQQQASEGDEMAANDSQIRAHMMVAGPDQDTLTFNKEQPFIRSNMQGGSKKLYPGQITLNHGIRKKEVQRINRENMVMLKALKDIKPTVIRAHNAIIHDRQQEVYKRNICKFRNVGRSQPRPIQRRPVGAHSEALPEINRYGSNQTDIKPFYPDNTAKHVGQRRTSQGNRSYLDRDPHQFAVPISQRVHYRNQRSQFNSNQVPSEYVGNDSTRHGTAPDEMDKEGTQGEDNAQIFPPPNGHQQTYQTGEGSIQSTTVDGANANPRRPSYLQKLKKSPLLQSMTDHQKIPKSIVNRVISQREAVDRTTFRKFGVVNRVTAHGAPIFSESYNMAMQPPPEQSISENSLTQMSRSNRQPNSRAANPDSNSAMTHGTQPSAGGNQIVDVQVAKQPKKRIPAASSKERKKEKPQEVQPKEVDSKAATKEVNKKPATKATPSPAQKKQKAVVIEDEGHDAQANGHEDGAQLESADKAAEKIVEPVQPKQPNVPSVSAQNLQNKEEIQTDQQKAQDVTSDEKYTSEQTPLSYIDTNNANQQATTAEALQITQESEDQLDSRSAAPRDVKTDELAQPAIASRTQAVEMHQLEGNEVDDESLQYQIESDQLLQSKEESKIDVATPKMTSPGDLKSRNELSVKSIPVTEGSKYSIVEDTAAKGKEEVAEVDEEYSIPNESQEDMEEQYSDGGFEAASPLKQVNEDHAATKTEIRSPHAMHQESQEMWHGTEKSSKATVKPIMFRQTTNDIGEEIQQMDSHVHTGENSAAGAAFPRQETFEIREDVMSSVPSSRGADNLVDARLDNEEVTSETKTMIQSKSQASKNYGSNKRVSDMAATGKAKGKLGKVPTAHDDLPENRKISMQTPGTDTQGTGFQTVKASANEEQRAINQSKENIILSEQSSVKQID